MSATKAFEPTPVDPRQMTAAERVRAFYPIEAKQGHIEEVAELVTHERPPPPNPLLRMEYSRLGGAGPVRAEPAQVHFAGLEEGGASLVQSLRLVNSSGNPVRMHIMHPQTPHFAISIGRNGAGKRGRVMPGMAEEVTVVCKPTELRYYRDTIRVHIEGGETMLVPLHAYPAVAEAAFPSIVDFGRILQGQSAQRILPLRSDTNVAFDFKVVVVTGHADFDIEPMSGVVPASGEAAVVLTFTPSRMATARAVIEVHVAQLGFKPKQITLVGSSSATQVKHATLAKLRHQAAVQQQQEYERRQQQSHRGALFEAEGDAASGGGALGEDVPGGEGGASGDPSNMEENDPSSEGAGKLTHKLKPVLLAEPSLALLEAIAAQPLGGGSGGGDAVTRAMALQLRHTVGDRSIPVKHPIPREPFPEDSKDGLRVPWSLETQYQVNTMLTQQRNKMRISDLRAAIERQQVAAEKQQEELEAAAMSALSVEEQLMTSFCQRVHSIIEHLQENDVSGTGMVSRAAFISIRKLLKVAAATPEDVGNLFDRIDAPGHGKVDYALLERTARRNTKRGGSTSHQSLEPAELDQALQGPERSRQLKELIFSREVNAIEDYEKQKEVKSFVAIGQPLMEQRVIDATIAARADHADQSERADRSKAAHRLASEREPDRVLITEPVVAAATGVDPSFDPYMSETWGKREAVLGEFQQGVRVAAVRTRVDRRIRNLKASLMRKGISMADKNAVHSFVMARSKGGAGPPVGGEGAGDEGGEGGEGGVTSGPAAVGLSLAGLAHFTFPEPPDKAAASQADPITIEPIEAFDETKLLALRVPRRFVQMRYQRYPLTAPGAFPPVEASRALRVGAPFESGRPLPTGELQPVPDTWGLPKLLLAPPPPPLPPSALAGIGGDTKVLEGAPAGEDGAQDITDANADGDVEGAAAGAPAVELDANAKAKLEEEQPPVLPRLMPKVMSQPPPTTELDTRQMLRPMPIACNEYWKSEAIGWSSAITCLKEPTLSSKWRAAFEPWADALVSLPDEMVGVVESDVAEELSEDESDTEIDNRLRFPPSLEKMYEIFDIPGAPGTEAAVTEGGDEGAAAAEEPPAEGAGAGTQITPASAAAEAMDEGAVAILPERSLPVDIFSECARAQAQLGEAARAARHRQRLQLRERFALLNECIEQPRHQLSLV